MKTIRKKKQINIDIGARIKKYREAANMTQEKLAEQIGVSVQYVSDLERGVTGGSVTTLLKICDLLHTSTDAILLGKTEDYDRTMASRMENFTEEQKQCVLEIIEQVEKFSSRQ